jgi:hypothetical protein
MRTKLKLVPMNVRVHDCDPWDSIVCVYVRPRVAVPRKKVQGPRSPNQSQYNSLLKGMSYRCSAAALETG